MQCFLVTYNNYHKQQQQQKSIKIFEIVKKRKKEKKICMKRVYNLINRNQIYHIL